MIIQQKRERPPTWKQLHERCSHAVLTPFFVFDWIWDWIAYWLSNLSFLEAMEHFGRFSVLIAVIFYFKEAPDRLKQKHYQAWQVINTAQGKGGSGGRIEALQELNRDHVALTGVDLSKSFLQGIRLEKAQLSRADLSAVDARDGAFNEGDLDFANLQSTNLRNASLARASLEEVNFSDADLNGADLSRSDLSNAVFDRADLRGAECRGIKWQEIRSLKGANVFGVKDAPDGFLEWAVKHGAVQAESDEGWRKLLP